MQLLKYRKKYKLLLNYFWLLFCLFALPASAEIYMRTAQNGVVTFSDQRTEMASPVILRRINSYSTINNSASFNPERNNAPNNPVYEKIIIDTPKSEQTFQNTPQIPVSITITPELNRVDKIEIWLDDHLYARGSNDILKTTLQNVERGEHRLQIKIIDTTGKVLISSKIVIFYLHLASIATTNNVVE